jgi:1-deoxy-D-xylulose-5-phosphate synthase
VAAVTGRALAVVNARFAKPLDETLLRVELERQPVVFTLEDHTRAGGFGSAVAEMALADPGSVADVAKLELLALPDRCVDHGDRTEQLASVDLDVETLTARVLARLERLRPVAATPRRATAGARP